MTTIVLRILNEILVGNYINSDGDSSGDGVEIIEKEVNYWVLESI